MGRKGHVREIAYHAREIAWTKMVPLASCLWFCVTASIAFFIRFLTRRVFRPRREHENCKENSSSSAPARLSASITEAQTSREEEEEERSADEEKETSVLQFRFSYQIPEHSNDDTNKNREVEWSSLRKDEGSSVTTSVSNYRVSSERDYRGFVEAPQAMTLCVQKSYIGSDGIVWSSTEELDRELKSRLPSVKLPRQVDSGVGVADELDRELTSRFLSVKLSGHDDPDVGLADREVKEEHKTMYAEDLSGADGLEELKLLDVGLPDEVADVTAGARFSPTADFGGFCSDSESEITSDGYSVKDLALDFDSDGFFSEEELETEIGKASFSDLDGEKEEILERSEQKPEATQLPNSPGSVGNSEKFDGVNIEPTRRIKNSTEINLDNLSNSDAGFCYANPINSPDVHDDGLPDNEAEQVHQEVMDQEEAIDDSSGTDVKSPITFHVGLGPEHFELVQTQRILCEATGGGSECLGGQEESELFSLESREPEGGQLPECYHVNMESVVFGNNEQNRNSNLRDQHDLSEQEPPASDWNSDRINGEEAAVVARAGLSRTTRSLDDATSVEDNSGVLERRKDDPQSSEETHLCENEESEELSAEEMEELDSLWEHDDLIDQLRMELRKSRATGLPTISEESESPRSAEDLKPWKLDARFLQEKPMEELHKLYKTYRERMKKLDVLNYQKMYAIGVLQLKNPLQHMGTNKPTFPGIASIVSQNIWLRRRQKSVTDHPSEGFIKELRGDLEMVYVGQTCLSWEFLRWQYERTRELLESDPHDSRQYNQAAGAFQQFQVLIQRFLENEPFQDPRVPNYVSNRCVLRNLLQVPVIREDCLKNKVKVDEKKKGKDAITGEQLEYIMVDSIRIFWEFVKKDKDETPLIMKGLFGTHVELQDPADHELMVDIQAILKQKQKKLKDLINTGNCLVKKFKKPRQGGNNQDDLFFSQVDMKLVSRVLKMPRITTDQLVWCHKKLSKITFLDWTLLREPSFLLFPC